MSNETASQSRNRTDTPRTDAKAGFANFDDAMKGGPGNVVPADFARELERELADALSGTDSLTWQYWRDRARAAESNTPSAIRGSVIEECAKVCELDGAKAWDKYKRGEPPYRANPYWEGCSDQADACADHIRALKNAAPQVFADSSKKISPYEARVPPSPAGAAPRCAATLPADPPMDCQAPDCECASPLPSSVEDRERWFVAREHAITIPGEARPSIGYIVVPKWPTFASFDEAAIFIKERDLPIGWVALRESQLAKRVPSATLERK